MSRCKQRKNALPESVRVRREEKKKTFQTNVKPKRLEDLLTRMRSVPKKQTMTLPLIILKQKAAKQGSRTQIHSEGQKMYSGKGVC